MITPVVVEEVPNYYYCHIRKNVPLTERNDVYRCILVIFIIYCLYPHYVGFPLAKYATMENLYYHCCCCYCCCFCSSSAIISSFAFASIATTAGSDVVF